MTERLKAVLWTLIVVNGLLGPVIVKAGYESVPYVLGPPRVLGMLGVGIFLASLYLYEWIKPRLRKPEREPVL